MGKTAVLFAGQGAQKPGMGKDLYDNVAVCKDIFDKAEQVLPGLQTLCFEASAEELNQTVNAQPCIVTMEYAIYTLLYMRGLRPECGAGLSLGEYAALASCGTLPFEELLRFVSLRAHWMQQQCEKMPGSMVAVVGKNEAELEAILQQVRDDGMLEAVNFNCPGQIVVAGDHESLERLRLYGKQNKVRVLPLSVGGAFHSSYMQPVRDLIAGHVQGLIFHNFNFTLYANLTAQAYTLENIKSILPRQTSEPVLFEKSIRNMIAQGVDTFVEVGPGNSLSGMVKRTDKEVRVMSVCDFETLGNVAKELNLM